MKLRTGSVRFYRSHTIRLGMRKTAPIYNQPTAQNTDPPEPPQQISNLKIIIIRIIIIIHTVFHTTNVTTTTGWNTGQKPSCITGGCATLG